MNSNAGSPARTREELEKLPAAELLRLKLSAEETRLLRAINDERDRARRVSVERLKAETATLVDEIRSAGVEISSLSDLIGRSARYDKAIPILLRHLQRPYSDIVRESIARSLAVPEAQVRDAWPLLVEEYRKAPTGRGIREIGDTQERPLGAKHGLACALSVAVTDETLPELIRLAQDPIHGDSRLLLISTLRRSKSPFARRAVETLRRDPVLQKEISSWDGT